MGGDHPIVKALRKADAFLNGPKEVEIGGESMPVKHGAGIIELINPAGVIGVLDDTRYIPKLTRFDTLPEVVRFKRGQRAAQTKFAQRTETAAKKFIEDAKRTAFASKQAEFNREFRILEDQYRQATTIQEKSRIAELMNELENWFR